ncbi:MAG: hypothetical protein KF816_08880 [Melioribacteraceae bacterium]|nr:hypothetical protein [Melioribacteraceae bacterium]
MVGNFKKTVLFFAVLLSCISNAQSTGPNSFYGGMFFAIDIIRSDDFQTHKKENGDLAAVDSLFHSTLKYFEGDISETLLALTFATVPFNKINFKIPLFKKIITIPLPSAQKSVFDEKVAKSPKFLFPDSFSSDYGDKDKLAHFFGNAFIRYSFRLFNLSKFLGIFVEFMEEGFFVNGEFSQKDMLANHIGEFFAEALIKNPNSVPSEVFLIYQLLFIRI